MAEMSEQYFTEGFNTELSPEAEKRFQQWLISESQKVGRDISLDLGDYDLRGAWASGASDMSGGMHLGDTFKKPNHPTFSDQSQYSGMENEFGGKWEGGRWEGANKFTLSESMMGTTHKNKAWLDQYYKSAEPNTEIVYPGDKKMEIFTNWGGR